MYTEAQEQGYAAGYEEGIANARGEAARIDTLLTSVRQSIGELDQQVAEQLLVTRRRNRQPGPAGRACRSNRTC